MIIHECCNCVFLQQGYGARVRMRGAEHGPAGKLDSFGFHGTPRFINTSGNSLHDRCWLLTCVIPLVKFSFEFSDQMLSSNGRVSSWDYHLFATPTISRRLNYNRCGGSHSRPNNLVHVSGQFKRNNRVRRNESVYRC